MAHAAIIGNGITGITAARRLRELQPDWTITVISGESDHHYSRPALMYIFMGHMRYQDTKPFEDWYWHENRIDLVRDWVVGIDTEQKSLALHRGDPISYDTLLLATGSKSNRFGWPGQDLQGVQGLYDLMDLHQLYQNVRDTRHAVIVGGGLIGIELGEMLHSRGVHVSFLVRESSYWSNVLPPEESAMVSRMIREEGFDLRLSTELKEIVDDGNGRAGAVITNHDERIECQLVGLTAGVSPNLDLVRETSIETNRGILVDWSLQTNVPGVFAAGDCAEIVTEGEGRNLLQQVWYTGKMQGAHRWRRSMAGRDERALRPRASGTTPRSSSTSNTRPTAWCSSSTAAKGRAPTSGGNVTRTVKHGMRLVIDDAEGVVTGINVMGLRYRHEVCERWIRERWTARSSVLAEPGGPRTSTPSSSRRHEPEIARAIREQMA